MVTVSALILITFYASLLLLKKCQSEKDSKTTISLKILKLKTSTIHMVVILKRKMLTNKRFYYYFKGQNKQKAL